MGRTTYAVRDDKAMWGGRTLAEWVPDLVQAIVAAYDPPKIILFGSVADGSDGPDSDIDLLVVLDELAIEDRPRTASAMYSATREIRAPHDLILTDAARFTRNRHFVGTIEYPAARTGVVVYDRAAA
jgi:uncharacterized protein